MTTAGGRGSTRFTAVATVTGGISDKFRRSIKGAQADVISLNTSMRKVNASTKQATATTGGLASALGGIRGQALAATAGIVGLGAGLLKLTQTGEEVLRPLFRLQRYAPEWPIGETKRFADSLTSLGIPTRAQAQFAQLLNYSMRTTTVSAQIFTGDLKRLRDEAVKSPAAYGQFIDALGGVYERLGGGQRAFDTFYKQFGESTSVIQQIIQLSNAAGTTVEQRFRDTPQIVSSTGKELIDMQTAAAAAGTAMERLRIATAAALLPLLEYTSRIADFISNNRAAATVLKYTVIPAVVLLGVTAVAVGIKMTLAFAPWIVAIAGVVAGLTAVVVIVKWLIDNVRKIPNIPFFGGGGRPELETSEDVRDHFGDVGGRSIGLNQNTYNQVNNINVEGDSAYSIGQFLGATLSRATSDMRGAK